MSINIPRNVLSLASIAHHERTRYAMNGMRIARDTSGACEAIATDGKMIARVTWRDPAHDESSIVCALLPRDACLTAAKIAKPHKAADIAKPQRDSVPLVDGVLRPIDKTGEPHTVLAPNVDGHYPPTEDYLDRALRGAHQTIVVNASMLVTLIEALNAAAGNEHGTIALDVSDDPRNPLRVRVVGHAGLTSAVGLLMPLVVASDDKNILPMSAPDCAQESNA